MALSSCWVVDDVGRWPGQVLSWQQTGEGWRALVRYRSPHESGHLLTREHWVPASMLEPRDDEAPPS